MKKILMIALCAALLAEPLAFAQEKPAKTSSSTSTTATKGSKMQGKHGKHQVMVKKTTVKKTEKKSK
ncbi:hypothetical protein [Larkinella humicola]|uniref:Pentapeptide MXKDX repeat protein n=1 Tax=Larkinella humicola TaxID=2607654 RepID=A0A5N1J9J0_9BACT|nr:hypothetical protein [Larkinella humicola]KAA9349095.1 hypothetical protein F0P93_22095 [Larkinella humicola]